MDALNQAVASYNSQGVLFGSYPFFGESAPRVIVTLEAQEESTVEAAKAFFLSRLPSPDWVLRVADDDVLDRAEPGSGGGGGGK